MSLEDTIEHVLAPSMPLKDIWVELANSLSKERKDRLKLPPFIHYEDGVFTREDHGKGRLSRK